MSDLSIQLSPAINLSKKKTRIDSSSDEDEMILTAPKAKKKILSSSEEEDEDSNTVFKSTTKSAKRMLTISDSDSNSSCPEKEVEKQTGSTPEKIKKVFTKKMSKSSSESTSDDEDFSNLRLFRGRTSGPSNASISTPASKSKPRQTSTNSKSPKISPNNNKFKNIQSSSSSDDESHQPARSKPSSSSNNVDLKFKSETPRLVRESKIVLPKKTNKHKKLNLEEFMKDDSLSALPNKVQENHQIQSKNPEILSENFTEKSENLKNLNKPASDQVKSRPDSLPLTLAQSRSLRLKKMLEKKRQIQKQVILTPGTTTEVSLVTFDLTSDNTDVNPDNLLVRANSMTSQSKFSLSPKNSSSSTTSTTSGFVSQDKADRKIEILVKRENPKTGTVELVSDSVSLSVSTQNSGSLGGTLQSQLSQKNLDSEVPSGIKQREHLKSILKKRIYHEKIDHYNRRKTAHENKLKDLYGYEESNEAYHRDGPVDFDQLEESYLQNAQSSQKRSGVGESQFNDACSEGTNMSLMSKNPEALSLAALENEPIPEDPIWEDDLSRLLCSGHSRSSEMVDSLTFVDGESLTSQDMHSDIKKRLDLMTQKKRRKKSDQQKTQKPDDLEAIEELCSGEFTSQEKPVEDLASDSDSDDEVAKMFENPSGDTNNSDEEFKKKADSESDDSDDEFLKLMEKRRAEKLAEEALEETQKVQPAGDQAAEEADLKVKRSKKFKMKKIVQENVKGLFADQADLSDDEELDYNQRKKLNNDDEEEGSDLDEYEEEENDEILKDDDELEAEIAEKHKKQEKFDNAYELAMLKERYVNSDDEDELDLSLTKVDRFKWNEDAENDENLLLQQKRLLDNSSDDEGNSTSNHDVVLIDPKEVLRKKLEEQEKKAETIAEEKSSPEVPEKETDDVFLVENNFSEPDENHQKRLLHPESTPKIVHPPKFLQVSPVSDAKEPPNLESTAITTPKRPKPRAGQKKKSPPKNLTDLSKFDPNTENEVAQNDINLEDFPIVDLNVTGGEMFKKNNNNNPTDGVNETSSQEDENDLLENNLPESFKKQDTDPQQKPLFSIPKQTLEKNHMGSKKLLKDTQNLPKKNQKSTANRFFKKFSSSHQKTAAENNKENTLSSTGKNGKKSAASKVKSKTFFIEDEKSNQNSNSMFNDYDSSSRSNFINSNSKMTFTSSKYMDIDETSTTASASRSHWGLESHSTSNTLQHQSSNSTGMDSKKKRKSSSELTSFDSKQRLYKRQKKRGERRLV